MGNIAHDDDEPTTREWVQRLVGGPEAESIISTFEWFEREVARLTAANRGAVGLLRNARLILSDHGQVDGDNCEECREMVAEIDAHLGGQ
jgi:hypothetical protein